MLKGKKAVVAIAGYGTRFLPYTKAVPKAMLPILNKPSIQIICEEIVNSGLTDVCFVVGYRQDVIENHFLSSPELEDVLTKKGNYEFYDKIKYPEKMLNVTYAIQTELNGTAKALECAKEFCGNEPFVLLFGDDVMKSDVPVTKQLINVFEKSGNAVIGCKNVTKKEVTMYASVEYDSVNGNVYNATKITEKPKLEDVKSTLSPLGRYVLTPEIFKIIENLNVGVNGEYQLTDALNVLAQNGKCSAVVFDGVRYDMGNILGSLKANIEFALDDEKISGELKEYLKNLIKTF